MPVGRRRFLARGIWLMVLACILVPATVSTSEAQAQESQEEYAGREPLPLWPSTVNLGGELALGSGVHLGMSAHYIRTSWEGHFLASLGAESIISTRSLRFSSTMFLATGRVGIIMPPPTYLYSVQAGVGVGGDRSTKNVVGHVGFYLGAASIFEPRPATFEFGYRYQFALYPMARPDWLGSHFFSIRIVFSLSKRVEGADGISVVTP